MCSSSSARPWGSRGACGSARCKKAGEGLSGHRRRRRAGGPGPRAAPCSSAVSPGQGGGHQETCGQPARRVLISACKGVGSAPPSGGLRGPGGLRWGSPNAAPGRTTFSESRISSPGKWRRQAPFESKTMGYKNVG